MNFSLTEILPTDKEAYLLHLQEKEIYERTLNIPFPYTEQHADEWLESVTDQTLMNSQPTQFATRDLSGFMIGSIGFDGFQIGQSHKAELGYWLAKPYWGQGIITEAVRRICKKAFNDFQLTRIIAHIFAFNIASEKVLLKNGFREEGYLHQHYKKDGKFFDGKIFGRLLST